LQELVKQKSGAFKMDDSFLVSSRITELVRIRDETFNACGRVCDTGDKELHLVDQDCKCQKKFSASLKYLKANIPLGDLQSHFDGDIEDKCVIEYDPIDKQMSKPMFIHQAKMNAVVEELNGKVLKDGYSFLFVGHNGSGKTHTGTYLLANAIDAGLTGYYMFFKDLYNLFNQVNYKDHEVDQSLLLDYVVNCQYLVIDELGKEKLSEPVIGFLEYLIKTRQASKLPTVFMTNLQIQDRKKDNKILERYGNSVWDCFRQYFIFQFKSDNDFRAKTRLKWTL
jgi:DNA replication protein DnaC